MAYMERRVIASDTIITVIKNTQENDASSDFFFKNLLIPSPAVLLDSVRHSMRSLQSKNELENIKPREDRKDFRYNPTKVNPDIL